MPQLLSFLVFCLASSFFCGLSGYACLRYLNQDKSLNPCLQLFFALSLGLLLVCTSLFVLGLVHAFSPSAILLTGALECCVAIWVLRRAARDKRLSHLLAPAPADCAIALTLFVCCVFACLHAPGYWDDTMYHLPLARDYIQHQGFELNPFLRFPLFPQHIDLLFGLGLMFSGELGAQFMATLPLFIMSIGILGFVHQQGLHRLLAVLAITTLLSIDPVRSTLGYAYIDNGLGLFCWACTLALLQWSSKAGEKASRHWLFVAGLFAGAAAASKFFGLVFASLGVLYIARQTRTLSALFPYVLGSALIGCGWYLRSYLLSGDPIHPAGGGYFGFYLWDAIDLITQKREQASFGVPLRSYDIFGALKAAGALSLSISLATFFIPNVSPAMRGLRFFLFTYLLFWFCVTQVDRYLAPVYASASLLAWYAISRIELVQNAAARLQNSWPRAFQMALVALIVFLLGGQLTRQFKHAELSTAQWQAKLESRSGYALLTKANALIPQFGPRIVQIGYENAQYFFKGQAIGDWFGPGRYRDMLSCNQERCPVNGPEQLIEQLKKFDARMLVISTKRFPVPDLDAFKQHFELVMQNQDGVLLVLKSN